jgi:Flp pilus assembly protein TadD
VAAAYYKQGKVEKSDSIINQLIIKSEKEKNIDFNLALIFAARGEKKKALQWYKSAYTKHDLGTIYVRLYSPLKLIINEPEVKQILKEIGL